MKYSDSKLTFRLNAAITFGKRGELDEMFGKRVINLSIRQIQILNNTRFHLSSFLHLVELINLLLKQLTLRKRTHQENHIAK